MNRLKKYFLLILIFIAGFFIWPYIRDAKEIKDRQMKSIVLQPDELIKVSMARKKLTIVKPNKVTIKRGVRNTVIIVKKDGTVKVSAPQSGLIFEPGICVYYAGQLSVGLDTQWFYWKNWGVYSGVGIGIHSTNSRLNVNLIGLGYNLPGKMISNTSIFVAYNTNQVISTGLRVRW